MTTTVSLRDPNTRYAPGDGRPLAAYGLLMGAFVGGLAGALAAARASGREIDRAGLADFAPRTTRLLSAMWAAQAIADGVQLAYSAGEQQT